MTPFPWPDNLRSIDPMETWRMYQAQSANTRGGEVPDIQAQRSAAQPHNVVELRSKRA